MEKKEMFKKYMETIELHINQKCFYNEEEETIPKTVREIMEKISPNFIFLGIKTWVTKCEKGFSIIWKSKTDWNVAWFDTTKGFSFRDVPEFE